MRIIVTIKQVLDPAGFTVHRRLERVFINREDYVINPKKKNALEEALRLKDAHGAEVIALSLGEPRVDDALREALALGADQAFLLTDETFAEADAAAAALILGQAIEKIGNLGSGNGYDLILTGQRALDTGASQIGPRLAEYLGLPQVLEVRQVSGLDNGKLRAERNWKQGYAEVEVGLPALLSIAPQANQPRYPHGARIMNAYREWEVTTWGLADLGLTTEELSPLIGLQRKAFPPERILGELITGTPDEAAKELAQLLREAGR
ncbi:MAG: electron transfer flavoprotein subunit beta/FixA family protein [Anaerolineae bacterium]|nr:electron transfer flavoprotein subunit beta/FixA family protein [Anaerolineae bacterium]